MRWAGHVVCVVERRGLYRVLVGKPKGERPLGRSRRRWEDNIKIDLQEVGCGRMDKSIWVRRGTDGGECGKNAENFLTGREPDTFSRKTALWS
jgi:hypothetical protein